MKLLNLARRRERPEVSLPGNVDMNAVACEWWNTSSTQTHTFVAMDPAVPFDMARIVVPPGEYRLFTHRYYTLHTDDGKPAQGGWAYGPYMARNGGRGPYGKAK